MTLVVWCRWCGKSEREVGPLLPSGFCKFCKAEAEALKRSA